MSPTVPEIGPASPEALKVLIRVGEALSDPKRREAFKRDPHAEVEDFDRLPAAVRDALAGMSLEELAALAKMSEALIENGFYVKTDRGALQMF